jgi:hypothetical protein
MLGCFWLSVWFGLVWFGLVWFGLVWFGLVWFGLVRKEIVDQIILRGNENVNALPHAMF